MAIATYSDLRTQVASYLARSNLTAQIPDFITLCEQRLNTILRTRQMEAVTSLTPVDGVCTLPADYLEWRKVVAKTSPRANLDYADPSFVDDRFPFREAGYPRFFTLVGSSLSVYPVTASDIELTYYQKIPALSESNTTNWLLTAFPSVYLYGALGEASIFIGNEERLATWARLFEQAVAGVKDADRRGRWSRGSARISGPTP